MVRDIPIFGTRNQLLPQKTRPCAYIVVANSEGLVAAARDAGKLYLPGGGIDLPETAVEAVRREVREELGCGVTLRERIGQAVKYFEKDGYCQALYATFYAGELGEQVTAVHETDVEWVRPEDLFHEHHTWAAHQSLTEQTERATHR